MHYRGKTNRTSAMYIDMKIGVKYLVIFIKTCVLRQFCRSYIVIHCQIQIYSTGNLSENNE